ncbi:MAG: LysM peptidoglycan-binding domain-containing protein [Opitutales bacterium]|nr:LysM peptidoglycan-binding domain-containing protein [Opitutales bacterium]
MTSGPRRFFPFLLAAAALCAPVLSGSFNEEIAGRIPPTQVKQLDVIEGLSTASLNEVAEHTRPERIRALTEELLELDIPAVGSRTVDEDGRSPVHRFIQERIEAFGGDGLEFAGTLRSRIAAPVALDRLLDADARGERAHVAYGGERWDVHPLWPNGPMPSLTPRDGLRGPLVYVRQARWDDLRGIDLDGAVAVIDFGGGRRVERLFSLGAVAAIVVEDDLVQYENARMLFTSTPNPYPRFFIDRASASGLIEAGRANVERIRAGEDAAKAHIVGGNVYEARPVESLFAYLPPTDPVRFEVRESTLLELIASDYGLTAEDLAVANDLETHGLEAGQTILIPGGRGSYTVRAGELLDRISTLYGTDASEIRAANDLAPGASARAGTTLTIPNRGTPMVFSVPIDSASVVPDAPHGARAMANLASALTLMEHFATSRFINRRRGVVFAFIDGDTLGGQGSRLLAEYFLEHQGGLTLSGGTTAVDAEGVIRRYEEGLPWMRGEAPPTSEDSAAWIAEEWLMGRVEEVRISLAEKRIPEVLAFNRAVTEEEREAARKRRESIEAELNFIVDVRRRSLDLRVTGRERLRAYAEMLEDGNKRGRLREYGLDRESLAAIFERELAEEQLARNNHENNLETSERLLAHLRGDGSSRLRMGWQLDLLDGSKNLGTTGFHSDRLREGRGGSFLSRANPRFRAVAAFAAERAGWEEDYTFIADDDRATLSIIPTRAVPVYDDFWLYGDVLLMPLSGQNDRTPLLDTPGDTLESVRFENLAVQARTAVTLAKLTVESPVDSSIDITVLRRDISRLVGRTTQFNIRSGIDARDPVAGTYVYLPMEPSDGAFVEPNVSGFYGYRRGVVAITLLNGSFRMPVETQGFHSRPRVYAHWLDRDEGLFRKVMTQGQVGTQPQTNEFQYRRGAELERNLVLIDTYPKVIFPGTDPHEYDSIGGTPRGAVRMQLVDAVIEGEPRDFAVDNPLADFREVDVEGVTIHMPLESRFRAVVQRGLNYRMLLVGNVEEGAGITRSRGEGISVGPGPDGDRNLYLALTPFHIAEQMVALGRQRLDIYRTFGISSRMLDAAVERGSEKLEAARAAKEERDWMDAVGSSRESWGILVKNYPRILQLGREAVFSVILLMAFLVPASWFAQSLFTKSKGIVSKLGWTAGIFTAGTLFLNYFHPAFRIALSPFIVVIAFTMILMSVIVIGICYQRFEVLLRRFRSASGEVESEEISFFSSLSTAFSLGVSNLRKRMFRTVLTVLTVTALTFSIIAFVAVTGQDTVSRTTLSLDTFLDGERVDPLPPAYEGVLFREFQWQEFPAAAIDALETEFGDTLGITVRAHYLEVEGGNNAAREGVNQIPVRHAGLTHVLTGIMVFQPNEPEFSKLNEAVTAGQWFLPERVADDGQRIPPDRFSLILPDIAAQNLGIEAEDLVDADGNRRPDGELPLVRMSGHEWRVIGILDTDRANQIRDVNGRSLAMVDYLRSGMHPAVGGTLEQEGDSFHMNWARLAIVPFAARQDVGAKLRAVALAFPDSLDQDRFFRDIALRLNRPFFAHGGGDVSFVVPRQTFDMAGLAKVVLPIILCILIVMNTMLGTVEERKGEVGMLGAIGLSPRQISFLMFSESTVFSIMGIVLGTFGGLLFANIVQGLNAADIAFLSGLSFNFTSILSMLLAAGTGLVVLMATLIPAKQAAALAAPSGMAAWELPPPGADGTIRFDLPFTLTRGNAVGMAAFFRQFLLNHTEPTSEDFNCREVSLEQTEEEGQPALILETAMWLSPYDLDVAQRFRMRMYPGDAEGVYAVRLVLTRSSGSEDNWQRTSYNFLNLVRQQFLFWRNLSPEARTEYIKQGASLLAGEPIEETQPA